MTLPLTPAGATQAVLWGGLLVGLALGGVAQASRFCTMGALADRFTYGGNSRLLMWLIAVVVAAAGSLSLIAAGWVDGSRTVAWSERFVWLSYLVGGLLFGYGMVLASGCPQRNLVRAGSGNLKAWVTLGVSAVAAEMTLRGLFAEVRVRWLDAAVLPLGRPQDLGSLLAPLTGGSPSAVRWIVFAAVLAVVAVLLWRSRADVSAGQWAGGFGVGALVVGAWALTGHVGFLQEHPDTLEAAWMGTYSHRPEGVSLVAPLAHAMDLLTLWSDKGNTVSFGVMVALGVIIGSAASAWLRGEFQIESFASADDLVNHLAGAVLMGFGGVTAMGCSIGQGITGLGMLSAGACLAVAGIVTGTWAALKVQMWRLERSA